MSNTDQILEQILNFLQKAQINNRLRDDSPSKGFDELNQAYKKSLGEDRKILEEIRKFKNSQDKHNNNSWRYLRGARSRSGIFYGISEMARERLTKRAIANQFGIKDKNRINAIYKEMPGFNKGFFGGTAAVLGSLMKLAKGLSAATWAVTLFVEILKATAEARKFYVPSMRQGYGFQSLGGLVSQSTNTLNYIRNPFIAGAYANDKGFKDAVAEIMSSGALNNSTIKSSKDLIKSFRFIASQGLILGETFGETARHFIDIASAYNLSGISGGNYADSYKYINKLLERGIQNGFSKAGLQQLLMQYDKSAAVSYNGLMKAFKDFDVMFKTINTINPNREQMPQYLNMFQNLMSGKVGSLSSFIALVAGSGAAVNKKQLESFAQSYQDMPGFGQKILAFRRMQQLTGLGTASLIELNKSEFGFLGNAVGRKIIDSLSKDRMLNYKYFNETKNLDSKQMVDWFKSNLNLTDQEARDVEKMVQITEVMSNPLEKLVTISTGMLNILWGMAGSKLFQMAIGDINIGSANEYIYDVKTKTGTSLRNIRRS